MKDNVDLDRIIINHLPLAIYVIDRSFEVTFFNRQFAELFQIEDQPQYLYLGNLTQCAYCIPEGRDPNAVKCNHCEIIKQHDKVFQSGQKSNKLDVVQEFGPKGDSKLMYLTFQSVPLTSSLVLVTVEDQTNRAQQFSGQ